MLEHLLLVAWLILVQSTFAPVIVETLSYFSLSYMYLSLMGANNEVFATGGIGNTPFGTNHFSIRVIG